MAKTTAPTETPAASRKQADRLGRSALTGRFVLAPAGKPGKVTVRDARIAVERLAEKRA